MFSSFPFVCFLAFASPFFRLFSRLRFACFLAFVSPSFRLFSRLRFAFVSLVFSPSCRLFSRLRFAFVSLVFSPSFQRDGGISKKQKNMINYSFPNTAPNRIHKKIGPLCIFLLSRNSILSYLSFGAAFGKLQIILFFRISKISFDLLCLDARENIILVPRCKDLGNSAPNGSPDPSRGPDAPAFRAGCSRGDEEGPLEATHCCLNSPSLGRPFPVHFSFSSVFFSPPPRRRRRKIDEKSKISGDLWEPLGSLRGPPGTPRGPRRPPKTPENHRKPSKTSDEKPTKNAHVRAMPSPWWTGIPRGPWPAFLHTTSSKCTVSPPWACRLCRRSPLRRRR